jgi:hypothetical protein
MNWTLYYIFVWFLSDYYDGKKYYDIRLILDLAKKKKKTGLIVYEKLRIKGSKLTLKQK